MKKIVVASGFIVVKKGTTWCGQFRWGTLSNRDGETEKRPMFSDGESTVWGPSHVALARLLEQVPEGTWVRVKCLGQAKAKKGQQAPYAYEVWGLDPETDLDDIDDAEKSLAALCKPATAKAATDDADDAPPF